MSGKKKEDAVIATVLSHHGGDVYSLKLNDDTEVMGKRSGRMRMNKIHLLVGDKVKVVLDPYGGHTTNRIVFRL